MSQAATLALDGAVAEGRKKPPLFFVDPALRLAASFAFALIVVSLDSFLSLILALLFALTVTIQARCALLKIFSRMAQLDGFMILFLLTLPFSYPGKSIVSLAGFSASLEGVVIAAQVFLKTNAILVMSLALVGRLETADIGCALARMGAPNRLVGLFCFTIRYIGVLKDEYGRLRLAMKARAFSMGFNLHTWRSIGYLFGMLLVRSAERAERIVKAMKLRGFDGRFRSLSTNGAKCPEFDRFFVLSALAAGVFLIGLDCFVDFIPVSPF